MKVKDGNAAFLFLVKEIKNPQTQTDQINVFKSKHMQYPGAVFQPGEL